VAATLPAAPAPRWKARALVLAVGALVVASFVSLDLRWSDFLSRDALARMAAFAASFFPPQASPAFLRSTFGAALETLAMSLLGSLLAAVGGLVLALPASLQEAGAGLPRRAARGVLNVLRAVPELVWASLLLIAAGLGPFPGTLALALHTTGVLGRLFAEAIENTPRAPADALRTHGVGPVAVFFYATLPQVLPQLVSYTLYRWENNIRAAAVLGVVGAGGLGQLLAFHMGLFHMGKTATVLIGMLLLVGLVDSLSYGLRRGLTR